MFLCCMVFWDFLNFFCSVYNTLYGGHIEGLGTIGGRGLGVVGGRVFDCQLSPVWRQVAVVNTVTGELWSAFVGCWELFRLAPIRCADWTGAITQIVYLIFYPLLRQLQKNVVYFVFC